MKKIFFLVFALILMSWGQASADYSFTYKSMDGLIDISGMLNTPSNGPGPLQVTGGYFGTATLFAGSGYSPSGAFIYDDLLFPASLPMLDGYGLLFTIGTNGNPGYTEINIWGNTTAINYTYYVWSGGTYTLTTEDGTGTFTVQPVTTPIPAAVWLLGTGLIALVGIRRRFRS